MHYNSSTRLSNDKYPTSLFSPHPDIPSHRQKKPLPSTHHSPVLTSYNHPSSLRHNTYSPITSKAHNKLPNNPPHKPPPKSTAKFSHKEYFQRPELRCIKPISIVAKNKHSQVSTFDGQSISQRSQISYQKPVSLDWEHIRRRTEGNLFKKLALGCQMETKPRYSSFCCCQKPCTWSKRWSSWAKMPKQFIYSHLKDSSLKADTEQQIKKDLKRTQPNKYITEFSYLRMLQEVLEVYSKYDKEVGYVQGMNMLVSVVLHHVKNPEQTFWILVDIMQRREYREIYLNDFERLKVHTGVVNKLVKYKINDLYQHLLNNGVELEMVTTGWFFCLMCNLIPLEDAHLLLDIFITEGFLGFYKVILTYLLFLKEELMMKDDTSDLLNRFSVTHSQEEVDWEEILQASRGFRLTESQIWSLR